ncbi:MULTISPECIES: nucleoside-diphosphate kinase [unclassified Pseudofrankia]|uniref:nucleoside-diphosphate kinase n=1 Tax=unclassified Pseudofrankia TaxID=2994372 RepID=UPI000E2A2B56|nr:MULTISPECIES: nucleoside-diphosphate kinase [unclassified Pseudofrankia]MDT3442927.1 nucleoside-diphosphate kinase [Pseudofrankia sp. BMG5.37]
MTAVDWTAWSVVLLKPDCVARDLVEEVLGWIAAEATIVDQRIVLPSEDQIFAHYADLLTTRRAYFTWVDVPADLRRTYVGQSVGIALAHGPDVARRLRELIGSFDPSRAGDQTVRGYFGTDSFRQAKSEGRLIANIIHTSDDPAGAEREFQIWYGATNVHLLDPTALEGRTQP